MTPEQALREARERQLRPIYLVVGEDQHRASAVVRALREAALHGGTPGLNEDTLTAGEASVDTVLAAARTLPMLARRRLVLVRGLERWEEKAEPARVKKPRCHRSIGLPTTPRIPSRARCSYSARSS